jgi:hypothetical protein
MEILTKTGCEPRTRSDREAEDADSKLRRSADIRAKAKPTDTEKHEDAARDVEAHAVLERNKHYRGHPPRV